MNGTSNRFQNDEKMGIVVMLVCVLAGIAFYPIVGLIAPIMLCAYCLVLYVIGLFYQLLIKKDKDRIFFRALSFICKVHSWL